MKLGLKRRSKAEEGPEAVCPTLDVKVERESRPREELQCEEFLIPIK